MRAFTSSAVIPLRSIALSTCCWRLTDTSHTLSTFLCQPHSISRGTSSTAALCPCLLLAAKKLSAACQTILWIIASTAFNASLSWKMRSATLALSSVPSSLRYSLPNTAITCASPSLPAATARRASASASKTGSPKLRSSAETVLLPEAMPPVKPIVIIILHSYFWQCSQ